MAAAVETGCTVFVVDDDASIREAMKNLLKSVGLHAEAFGSAEEFLYEARPDLPSCLVLDVKLPGVNGLEFQEQLRRVGISIPIVFLTAHGDLPANVRALKGGAVEFLTKPFQKDELLTAVHHAVDLDRARREKRAELAALHSRIADADSSASEAAFEVALLKKMASSLSLPGDFQETLAGVVDFVANIVKCDSCLLYAWEGDELVLRASMNSHQDALGNLRMKIGQGITGWVAEHRQPVTVARKAYDDPRFKPWADLPEDHWESFLSVPLISGARVVGVINLQNREEHHYTRREMNLMGAIGFLVGAEVERARLENENQRLTGQLEARKVMERAKGILQRDMKISEEEAYLMLQRESRQRRKPMREVAEAVILSDELKHTS